MACVNDVTDSLKSCSKIYYLKRGENEVRVNDYNPLLLMLWRANMDLQYISETSLALTEYVSGYVTKAEKSNVQDIWNDISNSDSVYKRLFQFGMRSMRSREVGLYEASDILLGDHLHEKSATVQWIGADMPHKRKRMLKNHSELKAMAAKNPNAKDIYAPSLIDNFYPTRPRELENVCLYDFVAHYKYDGNDKNGERKYRKLTKPVLPNHKIFNPLKEEERESYYYSLMILFVPFRYEAGLILDGETVEEAFQRHRNDNDSLNMHHDKFENLLGAEKKWKEIQDARKNIGLGEAEEAELKNRDDDEPQLLGEIMDAVNDIADMNNNVPNLTLDQRVAMLNSDQKRIV